MAMQLKKINDWDSETWWISPKQNNGDFDFWFVLHLQDMDASHAMPKAEWEEAGGKYLVDLLAVSPNAAGDENCLAAAQCCGQDEGGIAAFKALPPAAQCELLVQYGVSASLYSKWGKNKRNLSARCAERIGA